jgi:hypothetical protein
MLTILNKYVLFVAIGVIAYLTYSGLSEPVSALVKEESNEIPILPKQMLNPVFIEPEPHASPVDRNPFIVGGADGFDSTDRTAEQQVSDGPAADSRENRDFSGELMGIIIGNDGQRLALIGGEIYSVGSFVSLSDSDKLWQIYSIKDESIVAVSNGQQTVLKISNICTDYNDLNDVDTDITKAEKQKESTQ